MKISALKYIKYQISDMKCLEHTHVDELSADKDALKHVPKDFTELREGGTHLNNVTNWL